MVHLRVRCWLPPVVAAITAVTAQAPLSEPVVLNRTASVAVVDGRLCGFAPRYKVAFDDLGFEFTAALGRVAASNATLGCRATTIARGEVHTDLPAATPTGSATHVEYDRGAAIERCDVGVDHLAWSFLFRQRPKGHGDLVVRARLHTDLTITPTADGLRFEQPGVGGIHMGKVVGVDAIGHRVQGDLRAAGGFLELTLPGEFVDTAALPFVLDPLLGTAFNLGLLTQPNDERPRAAFDVLTDSYLVVWQTWFSLIDVDVYGQRLSRTGSLLGSRIAIATAAATIEMQPDVANVRRRGAFVVLYTLGLGNGLLARAVSGVGTVSAAVTVVAGTVDGAVGGDSASALTIEPGNVVAVWDNNAVNALQTAAITVNRSLTLSVGTVRTFESGTGAFGPRISKGGGGPGRFAVVYQRGAPPAPWLAIVDITGTPLTIPLQIGPAGVSTGNAAVDGDGARFVVAWEDDALGPERQIVARHARFVGNPAGVLTGNIATIANQPNVDDRVPSVVWTGGSALVTWWQNVPIDQAPVRSIDPFQCTACEGTFVLGSSGLNSPGSGCAAASGGGPQDDAVLLWTAPQAGNPNNRDVLARMWRAADGATTTVAGGCGNGGVAEATCIRAPNPDFAHRLRGASPNAPAFLLQSLGQENDVCGSCTRIPALAGAVALFVATDSGGNAAIRSAIPDNPSLRGLVQFEQWLTMSATGACPTLQIDLSTALRLVID